MICPKCSKEIKDDSKFCIFCGANVQTESNLQNDQPQEEVSNVTQNVQQQQGNMPIQSQFPVQNCQMPPQTKKPMNKKLLLGIIGGACALLIVFVVAIVLVVTHKTKINLNDYVTVSFEGYDSYGKASVDFDYDQYYDDLMNASSSFKRAYNNDNALSLFTDYYKMTESFDYSLDKKEGLSNGDTVTLSFEYDDEAASNFKLKFVGKETEYTVEGLKEVKKIDPFEGVTVKFSGTSPNAYAEIEKNNSDSVYSHIYYDISKSSGIKIGDKITVTVSNNPEYFVEDYGCTFITTSKEYECQNVDQYVSKVADIQDQILDSMKKQTEDVINSYFASNNKYIGLSDLKFEGTYFLNEKEANSWNWNGHNQIYIIYSGKVNSNQEHKGFDTTTVYFPVKFIDIIQYADGTQYVDLNSKSISGRTSLSFRYTYVNGYTDKADMYNDIVTAQKDEYTEEITEGLK